MNRALLAKRNDAPQLSGMQGLRTLNFSEKTLSLLCALSLLSACPRSIEPEEDAGIVFDASGIDATPDADNEDGGEDDASPDAPPPVESDIGESCETSADCDEFCITEFPGGYCTEFCGGAGGGECPDGSTCTEVGRGMFLCLDDCDGSGPDACRDGYGCGAIGAGVCIPGCDSERDCDEAFECDEAGGFVGEGICFDPDSQLGDACGSEEDCPSGAFCFEERFGGWPGGACLGLECDVESNTGCPEGAHCIQGQRGGLCVQSCDDSACREGYECDTQDDYPDRPICVPGCDDSSQCTVPGNICNAALGTCDVELDPMELGAVCSTVRGACRGGSCFTEFESGYPGSSCVYAGCEVDLADPSGGCPRGGVCQGADLAGTESPICIPGCDEPSDCRDGYRCAPLDPANEDSAMGCVPGCDSDADCANDGTDGAPDFACNVGTGLCTFPADPVAAGRECASADQCRGGECLTEAETGWPGGYCAPLGCRLSGEGPSVDCPEGFACADNESGDPAIGWCVRTCTAEGDECRDAERCEIEDGAESGSCVPGCTGEDDCGEGRDCDPSGRCV